MNLITIATCACLVATPAYSADIYKCPTPSGKVEFQDRPCITAAGTKITVQPNSVEALDQSATKAKREAVDKRLAESVNAEVAENHRRAAHQQARLNECQGYIDEADRQRAWLRSISPAVAQSAANEIAIQGRKYRASRCEDVMR